MTRVAAFAAVLALAFTGTAAAKAPTSAQDEGGGQTIHVWVEYYWMNQPPWGYYCRYASDGYNTWQISCWT